MIIMGRGSCIEEIRGSLRILSGIKKETKNGLLFFYGAPDRKTRTEPSEVLGSLAGAK